MKEAGESCQVVIGGNGISESGASRTAGGSSSVGGGREGDFSGDGSVEV